MTIFYIIKWLTEIIRRQKWRRIVILENSRSDPPREAWQPL